MVQGLLQGIGHGLHRYSNLHIHKYKRECTGNSGTSHSFKGIYYAAYPLGPVEGRRAQCGANEDPCSSIPPAPETLRHQLLALGWLRSDPEP